MLDQILGMAVIWLPVVISVVILCVPARSEDARRHMKWRYWLAGAALVFGVLSWWQQSRAVRTANTDRESAIKEASARVSADVTKAVTDQYAGMIADQKKQISDLQAQLKAQGKDVSIIKSSNIVTGRKPVPVQVMNMPPTTATVAQVENLRMSWEPETSTHNDAPYAKKITIQADAPVNPVKLAIICDAPIKYGEIKMAEPMVYFGANEIYKQDAHIYIISMSSQGTAILRPDAPLVVHLYSDQPLNVVRGERGPR